ncbi:MAG: hypothetical protein ACM3Q2_09695 [Syntrophothermus sp.]
MKQILLIIMFSLPLCAQEKIDVKFESEDGHIVIHYFLHGDPGKEYDVNAVVKKQNDPSFELVPENTTGDVGKGKFAGKERTIIWNIAKNEEEKIGEDDFFLEITADEAGTGIGWYWYLLGGAAAAGGTAAVLLLTKKDDTKKTNGETLAVPPGRP